MRSTPRTREYVAAGESDGKSLLDAMRDGRLDGMQDFDTVIKGMIEDGTVTLEDGLSFATNPNNLQLALKGLAATDDFRPAEPAAFTAKRPAAATPARTFPTAPARPAAGSMLDMLE